MRKRHILTTILMTAFLFNAAAHSLIRGKVIDAKNGFPLQGASVMITGTENGTVTDETGNFILRSDSAITSILVSYLGYTKKRIEVHDPTAYLIIRLQPAAVKIGEVNVTRLRTNPLKPLATIDVDLRPVNTSQDMLRLIPGLFIAQHAGGGKAEQIFLRGFDMDHGTDISIHVDGMPVNMVSHAHGQGYADLHFLIPETIGDVDFDKGPYSLTHGHLENTFSIVGIKPKCQNCSVGLTLYTPTRYLSIRIWSGKRFPK